MQLADDALYRSLARPLWAILYSRCCDAELAGDAVQEAFVRWYQRPAAEVAVNNPKSWLLRVANNWIIDQARRDRCGKRVELPPELSAPDQQPLASLLDAELSENIRQGLKELTDEDREVLVFRYALDWSSARIADALDCSSAAVDMRLSRARRRLAELLAKRGVGDVVAVRPTVS